MESNKVPYAPRYNATPPTAEELEWADLPTVDLSLACTPEGMDQLAKVVKTAMRVHGFLYVINHGLTPEQVCRLNPDKPELADAHAIMIEWSLAERPHVRHRGHSVLSCH